MLRKTFQPYANIRPSRTRRGLTILDRPMNLVIVRENNAGFDSDRSMYAGSGPLRRKPTSPIRIRLHIGALTHSRLTQCFHSGPDGDWSESFEVGRRDSS